MVFGIFSHDLKFKFIGTISDIGLCRNLVQHITIFGWGAINPDATLK